MVGGNKIFMDETMEKIDIKLEALNSKMEALNTKVESVLMLVNDTKQDQMSCKADIRKVEEKLD